MDQYLKATSYLDWDHPRVREYAEKHAGGKTEKIDQAQALYYAIRDGFYYFPYYLDLRPQAMKASYLLERDCGYCVEKAMMLAATARALGIPSRLGFAQVVNHIGTEKIEKFLKTNVMVFHGYTELYLEGQWVKATPAFNWELCLKFGVEPLEFNGREDSLFQQYSGEGKMFMEYLYDYGHFEDMPFDLMVEEWKKYYPQIFERAQKTEDGYVIDFRKSS